jgi:hypothetical protein
MISPPRRVFDETIFLTNETPRILSIENHLTDLIEDPDSRGVEKSLGTQNAISSPNAVGIPALIPCIHYQFSPLFE